MAETAAGFLFEKTLGYDPFMEFGAEVKKRTQLERDITATKGAAEASAIAKGTTTAESKSYLGGLFSSSQIQETGKEKSSNIEAGAGQTKINPTSQSGTDAGKTGATGTGTADSSNAFSGIAGFLTGDLIKVVIIIAALILLTRMVK